VAVGVGRARRGKCPECRGIRVYNSFCPVCAGLFRTPSVVWNYKLYSVWYRDPESRAYLGPPEEWFNKRALALFKCIVEGMTLDEAVVVLPYSRRAITALRSAYKMPQFKK